MRCVIVVVPFVVAVVVAFAVVVTVDEAYHDRLALADGDGAVGNNTAALAYDVSLAIAVSNRNFAAGVCVSAIKPYEGFGDVDHTIKELMSF
jgi:hypothetical protein